MSNKELIGFWDKDIKEEYREIDGELIRKDCKVYKFNSDKIKNIEDIKRLFEYIFSRKIIVNPNCDIGVLAKILSYCDKID